MVITAQNIQNKPGYKQTEVGVIPEDWEVKKLERIADLTSSKRIFEHEYVSSGIPFYRGKEISQLIDDEQISDMYFILESRYNQIKSEFGVPNRGDILITAVGTLGNVYVVPDESRFYFKDGNLIWLRGIKNADSYYLASQIRKKKLEIINNAIGSSQKALTIVVLKNILIPLPSLTEQQAIATALSDVDALITSLDKLITKKRDIKQATMQQLLTGKMRLPGFSSDGNAKLGDFFELNPNKPHLNNTDLVAFIRMEDVSENGSIINQNIIPLSSIKKGLTFFERNDVLVAKITPCFENGKGACLDTLQTKSGFGSTEFHVLRAKKNAIPRYLFYQTQTVEFRQQLEAEMIGTAGQKRVPAQTIINYSLPVLHLIDEQQAIATVLSEMDAEITALERKRDKIRVLKQGMMQELLTGKTRLL
jgi:type I restriction enzyme S subunit